MHILPSKYVFRVKHEGPKSSRGTFGKFDIFGLDCFQSFYPVVKMVTTRTIFALATVLGWEIAQMDVVTEFFYGDLDEIFFMERAGRSPH